MTSMSKMILVNAPVELVWSYLENPLQVAAMNDQIIDVRDLRPSKIGSYDCTLVYEIAGQALEIVQRTTEYVRHERLVTQSTRGLESVQAWTLQQTGTVTTVNFDIDYHVEMPLLGRFVESIASKQGEAGIEKMLLRLKDTCEALSAQSPAGP